MRLLIGGLFVATLLAGCATPPPPAPLPYHFTIADIRDGRLDPAHGGTDPLYDALPYDAGVIGLAFIENLPYSVYGAREAKLHLKVTHYQATSDGNGAYAVSIALQGYADDDSTKPHPFAHFEASCSESSREGFALDAIAKESVQERSLKPVTVAGRDRRMWRETLHACTRELARQFATVVAANKG